MLFFKKFGSYFYDNFLKSKRRRKGKPKSYLARYSRKQREFPLDYRGFLYNPFMRKLKSFRYNKRKYLYFLLLLFPLLFVPNVFSFEKHLELSLLFHVEQQFTSYLIDNKFYFFFIHYAICFSYIMEPTSFFVFMYWKYLSKFFCINFLSFSPIFFYLKFCWIFPFYFFSLFFFLKWVAIIKGA